MYQALKKLEAKYEELLLIFFYVELNLVHITNSNLE